MLNRLLENAIRSVCLLAALLALAACGGGGGDSGGPGSGGFLGDDGESKEAWTLTLSLKDSAGNDLSALDAGQTATLQVLFLYDKDTTSGNNGEPVSGEVVNVSATLADVSPADGRVTNDDGIAEFTVIAGKFSGAAVITATAEGGSATVTGKLNVNVDGIEVGNITSTLTDLDGAEINRVDPLTTGRFEVTVTDETGAAISDLVVTAATDVGELNPSSGTALTQADGKVSFIVTPGAESGAGTFNASVSVGSEVYETLLSFEVSTELPYDLALSLENAAGDAIDSAETAQRIVARVALTDDRSGEPLPYRIVLLDVGDLGTVIPATATTITDSEGKARFEIQIGDNAGAYTVAASSVLAGGQVSTNAELSVGQAVRKLGHFEDDSFNEGVIGVQPSGQISANGTAALNFDVVDQDDERATSRETLTISSECLLAGKATLTPPSPIEFNSRVSVSYTAQGCSGSDEVTASLASSGAEASVTLDIAPVTAESIAFVEATPATIALRNTGSLSSLSESSNIDFKVSDLNGNPVADVIVNFSLGTTVGGLALNCSGDDICDYANDDDRANNRSTTATSRSGTDGIATAKLLSGYVATAARIVAYADLDGDGVRDSNEPQSASNQIIVTTGLPDQNSVSISSTYVNVEGAYDIDGVTTEVTVRMADRFNNPVPDGTQATFITEYGSIEGGCTTTDGACSVTWTSQSPRDPAYAEPLEIYGDSRYSCASHSLSEGPCPTTIAPIAGYALGGRSSILVYALGEESFTDGNGNGRYDEGESWINLPEAFLDENEDSAHTPSQTKCVGSDTTLQSAQDEQVCNAGFDEFFVDFNSNGVYDLNNTPESTDSDLPDGLYNGVLCQDSDAATGVCSNNTLNIGDNLVLVMGFSDASAYSLEVIDIADTDRPNGGKLRRDENYNLYVSDRFNNPPPPGSEISFEGSGRCDVLTPAPTIGDSNAAAAFAMGLSVSTDGCADPSADPDNVSIILALPNGSKKVWTYSCEVTDPGTCTP